MSHLSLTSMTFVPRVCVVEASVVNIPSMTRPELCTAEGHWRHGCVEPDWAPGSVTIGSCIHIQKALKRNVAVFSWILYLVRKERENGPSGLLQQPGAMAQPPISPPSSGLPCRKICKMPGTCRNVSFIQHLLDHVIHQLDWWNLKSFKVTKTRKVIKEMRKVRRTMEEDEEEAMFPLW